ncbi:MAG: hypothetical protein ACK559_17150, partial [bacterium]
MDPETLPELDGAACKALEEAIEAENIPVWSNDLDMALGVIVVMEHEEFESIFEKFAIIINAWVRSPSQRNQAIRKGQLNERMRMSHLFQENAKCKRRFKKNRSVEPSSPSEHEVEVSQG